jgi:hypothetical protein
VQRQAMTYCAAFLIRRNHDEMRKTLKSLFQGPQPFGVDPIIIGKQNNCHSRKK